MKRGTWASSSKARLICRMQTFSAPSATNTFGQSTSSSSRFVTSFPGLAARVLQQGKRLRRQRDLS